MRIEHPQSIIDQVQYHCTTRDPLLPPAAYSWVEQVNEKGVFSFCMCPGGIIAPAATNPGELVVNGWSPSKRNNPYANSGIVVSVEVKDLEKKWGNDSLSLLRFQQSVEQIAFQAGGGHLKAPAQRLVDFCENITSSTVPDCSYLPGISSVNLTDVLPPFIFKRLQKGFKLVGRKMKNYFTLLFFSLLFLQSFSMPDNLALADEQYKIGRYKEALILYGQVADQNLFVLNPVLSFLL